MINDYKLRIVLFCYCCTGSRCIIDQSHLSEDLSFFTSSKQYFSPFLYCVYPYFSSSNYEHFISKAAFFKNDV